MSLVYAIDKNGRDELLARGFKFLKEQQLNNQTLYMFINQPDKVSTFSLEDKSRFFVSDKMFI